MAQKRIVAPNLGGHLNNRDHADNSTFESLQAKLTEPEKKRRRHFNDREREAIFIMSGGVCQHCSCILKPYDWQPDHIVPYARGGLTDVTNGQALCTSCNLKKGARING